MFPTTAQILNQYLLPVSFSLFALVVIAGFSLWLILGARAEAGTGKTDLRPWLFAAAGLLVWMAGAYVFNGSMFSMFRQQLDLQRIAEIRVTSLGNGKSMTIKDRTVIASGFSQLPTAKGYSLDNERLLPDGYRIELMLDGAANYSPLRVNAHRQSRRGSAGIQPVTIVAVSESDDSSGVILNSPAFHSWLRRNVDPLFAPPPVIVQ